MSGNFSEEFIGYHSDEWYYDAIRFNDETFPIYILENRQVVDRKKENARETSLVSWHEQLEILYVLEGSIVCVSSFERHICRAGEVAIINPCEAHFVESNGESARYHCLMIDTKLLGGRDDIILQKYLQPFISQTVRFPTVLTENRDKVFAQSVIDELIEEYHRGGAGFELAVKGNLLRLLSRFFRYARKNERKRSSLDTVLPALQYIADHYTEEISLANLASECCMNPSYFCRIFREITGRSAITYVSEYRLTKARALLLTTRNSISEISFAVGFSDAGYFTRKFKQFYGKSPREFRNAE